MFLILSGKITLIVLLVILIAIIVLSFIFSNRIRRDFKKLYRARSRFHIEIRKIVNLIFNIHKSKELEPYTKVVIKNLSHQDKVDIINAVDEVFNTLDVKDKHNKYIVETYHNMYMLMDERDKLLEEFNQLITAFPHCIYARFMKLPEYDYYTHKN